jgi:tetratricopeptide (TPR) repeat protein
LADAHLALASIKKVYDWDWPAAEQGYKRALELSPNYAASHHGYADHLAATGRTQEAICEIVKAQEVDTLSLVYSMEIAWNWFMAREYERALEQSFKTLEMEPLANTEYQCRSFNRAWGTPAPLRPCCTRTLRTTPNRTPWRRLQGFCSRMFPIPRKVRSESKS